MEHHTNCGGGGVGVGEGEGEGEGGVTPHYRKQIPQISKYNTLVSVGLPKLAERWCSYQYACASFQHEDCIFNSRLLLLQRHFYFNVGESVNDFTHIPLKCLKVSFIFVAKIPLLISQNRSVQWTYDYFIYIIIEENHWTHSTENNL